MIPPVPVIDAHLHLWDPARFDYDWLRHVPAIAEVHGPNQFQETGILISQAIFVQSDCSPSQALTEAAWAASLDFPISGIIAYAPLELGIEVAPHLTALAALPRVRGVRRNAQNEATGFMIAADYVTGMRLAAQAGLAIDMCIRAPQLPELLAAAIQVPAARIILDHLGKPDIARHGADSLGDDWADNLSRLAELPHVWCKLSGLPTQAAWTTWRAEQLLPYLAHALTVFGPERCLFGGDWPVVDLAGGYAPWRDVVATALANLPPEGQNRVWSGSANDVYRL